LDKIKLSLPVIVEGKYDKIKILSVADATVITTDGFGVFNNAEKRAVIRRLSEKGVILLCDSDGAGKLIRSHLSGLIPPDKVYQLYVPQIKGKEKRKQRASAEGFLGVEGISADILRERILSLIDLHPEVAGGEKAEAESITKTDFYFAGLSGGDNSAEKRDRLAAEVALPAKMSANALLSALNMIITKEVFNSICGKLDFYKEN
jgi:ribonuclease M5